MPVPCGGCLGVAHDAIRDREALHYRELDKQATQHIKDVHMENLNLQDDTYILRRALLNTKVKQKALERQL